MLSCPSDGEQSDVIELWSAILVFQQTIIYSLADLLRRVMDPILPDRIFESIFAKPDSLGIAGIGGSIRI
jgi:hypothetical protein